MKVFTDSINNVWLYEPGEFYYRFDKSNNRLYRYNSDGWKHLIATNHPLGRKWNYLDDFDSVEECIEYIKRSEGI